MKKPTLQELLAQYGSPAKIPEDKLCAAGYERFMQDGPSSASTVVQIRRIGAPEPQPPASLGRRPSPAAQSVNPHKPNWGWRGE